MDLTVQALGPCKIDTPLVSLVRSRRTTEHYVDETDRVLFDDTVAMVAERDVPRTAPLP